MTARALIGGGLASAGVLLLLSPILLYVAAVASLLALTLKMINATFDLVEAALVLLPVLAIALVALLTGANVAAGIDSDKRALASRRNLMAEPHPAEPRSTERVVPRGVATATGRKGGEREDDDSI